MGFTISIQKFISKHKDNKNVVIVGGGPVGLITGIKFKLKGYNVLILERTKSYIRDYIFFIQNSPQYSSILDLPKEILLDHPTMDIRIILRALSLVVMLKINYMYVAGCSGGGSKIFLL